ncbi:MAG: acetyl-CoA carboxylase biotin carboxyl carrier protein subunit [Hyphomicrobiaceae bacterium]
MTKHAISSDVTGTVFKIETAVGAAVSSGDTLIVLESMKMEIPVEAPASGMVVEILVAEGDAVSEGQALAVLEG